MFTKEKIKDLHYSVNGTIKAADLQIVADEILIEHGKTVKMPGFRAGKFHFQFCVKNSTHLPMAKRSIN